jgi:ring-1,2-phenylacetyl-CoA epoxidase subunit PaaB
MTISRTDTTNVQAGGPDERPAAAKPAGPGPAGAASKASGAVTLREWPLWEVFVRPKAGLDHKHCGSLHAADPKLALQLAREVYTRRQEGVSIWVVRSDQVVASDPADKAMLFDPMEDKVYRHPTFYELPPEVGHM